MISHLNSRAAKPEDRNRLAGFINVGLDPSRADYQEARVILLQVISAIRRLSPGAAFDGPKLHVHVDYGKAAEASMEEGDAVSAVHYMEISRELLASQGSHLMSGGEIAICDLAERVLNMVDEPDLRYGLRSYSDLQTAFSHAFAEGDFGTSLMFFDAQRNQMSGMSMRQSRIFPRPVKCSLRPFHAAKDERTSARLAQSLYGLGVHHTLTRLLSSTAESQSEASQVDDLVDLQYALAWKYARWDWSPSAVVSVTDSKNQLIFNGFRRVKDISVASPTSSGDILAGILVPLRSLTNPNSKNVDNPAVFHFLREAAEAQTLASWTGAHWLARLKPLEQNFERSEEMIFWRIRLLLEVLDDRTRPDCAQRGRLHDELIAHGNCYLDLTLTNRRPQFAMNMWSLMECSRTLLNHFLSDRQKFDWDVMQTMGAARILWETGQNLAATTLLKSLIGRMAASGSVDYDSETSWRTRQVQFDTLLKLGQWTAAIHSEPPEIIVKEYFGKALTLASEAHIAMDTDAKRYTIGNVHYELAKFSDAEYSRFIGSELFAASDQVLRMQEAEIRIYDSQLKSERNAAAKKRLTALRKKACVQLELDRRDRQRRLQEHMCFLERALSGYLRTLALCDYHDDCVYRFCSLWLGLDAMYSGASENGHAIRETAKELSAVESRKFVPLIYQLSAKLSSIPEAVLRLPFGESLFSLVARIARDHPHHWYLVRCQCMIDDSNMNNSPSPCILAAYTSLLHLQIPSKVQ